MIIARLKRDAERRTYELDMSGHAGYAERGKDIVCAGCSALAYAAYNTLVAFAEAGHCTVDEAVVGKQGEAEFQLRITADDGLHDALTMSIFAVLAHGLEAIALQYPKHVSFELANE